MKVEAFIIAWNRADTIHLTLKHYLSFCEKVTLYDNFSTDRTSEIARAMGVDVKWFGRVGQLNDQHYLDVKNNCWKDSKADWVIVVDDDEIIWHPDLIEELQQAKNAQATIFKPKGFNVFSNLMPSHDWVELKRGVFDDNMDKMCVFDPQKITEIDYVFGCHEARPKGIVRQVDKLFLLHYRAVGGVQRLIDRHRLYAERMSPLNMKWRLGFQYLEEEQKKREWFQNGLANSVTLSAPGIG